MSQIRKFRKKKMNLKIQRRRKIKKRDENTVKIVSNCTIETAWKYDI
jgi:hypothetical protein